MQADKDCPFQLETYKKRRLLRVVPLKRHDEEACTGISAFRKTLRLLELYGYAGYARL